ncbi:sensor histidine kinase [Thalassovita mediterranea]|jgi:two-component system sensor histidine kinase TctE|uniref:histidine kinase n=1 Tax=Thalassovita mediterranea TaxID=340021 RepID=A0A0P1H011_9RHOB|nr:sensor histidine kinase [Thalassovita mediterranea]CUH83269.1 Sensor protein QseC [Thalassovita mediterranea]SIS33792.1 two-component system, OmpR family, sensor histidine kinase TctE [Thalassovita mediterranea]
MRRATANGSLRRRLLLSLLASSAVLAIVVYFVVQSVARQVAQDSQDNVLTASALSILDSARLSSGEITIDLPYSALSMLDSISDERVFYAIRLEDTFLSGYADLPQAVRSGGAGPAYVSTVFLGEEVRVATVGRRVSTDTGQRYLHVSVAQTLSGQKQALARISRTSMGIGAGFFLVSVLLAGIISRSTIRPLDRLTASMSRRGPRDLRPVAAPVPSEMVPLVTSLNSFMRRLHQSLRRSEDFIAEAAHRVRTPLAVVRTKAEVAERKSTDPETRKALTEMIRAIDDSSRTAGQLLDHAMVTFRLDHLTREEIALHRLVEESVERTRPTSELKDITLDIADLDTATVKGDPILVQNALLNLLDNAVKYAPAGADIKVALNAGPQDAVIRVTDTGPGFLPSELSALPKRFTRGANTQSIVGSGLGLTIAKEVIEAHGGTLKIANTTGGGACVSLLFPLS